MPDSCCHAVTASMPLPSGHRLRIPTWMAYDPQDCLAVRMTFGLGGPETATWIFAWDLLARGLTGAVGLGDVRVTPSAGTGSRLLIRLGRLGQDARVELDAAPVRRFVSFARERAPLDTRTVRSALDAELSRIVERA
ncbi:SsgA family sporulation/cell division regulator [Streptomyces sp. NPDC008079]|uniref:SsgA family sporulation/cell division regulator n=1 Tax=Streptomyces sp. NPDC008079 TaxID=3364806 RepID=UPI0036EC41A7